MTEKKMNRRTFLRTQAISTLAIGSMVSALGRSEKNIEQPAEQILNYQPEMSYRQIGNSGIWLSLLSLGGLDVVPEVHDYAIEKGVNLVHISTGYKGGASIRNLARVLKQKRHKVYVAVKDNFSNIDEVLGLLGIDTIDFLMFNRHKSQAIDNEKIAEEFERYRKAGKVRYAGLTSHGHVQACTRIGIESGLYSVVMPSLSQPGYEEMQPELDLAGRKNIGVIAMKTLKGIKERDLQVAFLKKIAQHPAITTVNKGVSSYGQFDDYFQALQETCSGSEEEALQHHRRKNRAENCMMCGRCESACPQEIEITATLRCKDYYLEQLKDIDAVRETLRTIAPHQSAANCQSCRRCEAVCPNGIAVCERLNEAREQFTTV
ncbi:hypothetical protein GF407_11735 [candidate division KSB1 bacterium]|nr:hypothetical protein [candidate division KSB1 bacterium]